MRLTALACGLPLVGALACASAAPLPGGPPDTAPPAVVGFTPDSGAVNFRGNAVVVQFDETISDRGTGANSLEALVTISPRDGEPRVNWSRNRIAVRPRGGFLPNTAYRITVLPGIADLRGNRTTEAYSVVVSTGATIPKGAITGVAFDWPGQGFARNAQVEAVRLADSAVFVAPVDSSGEFTVAPLAAGAYVLYAYVDQNRNRARDRTEAWDSTRVVVGDSATPPAELLLAPRDTFPARLQAVTVMDSVTLAIEFDKPLDPAQAFAVEQARVVRADSTPVAVAALMTRAAFDSAARAVRDTTPAVRDTAAARDTARTDTTTVRARGPSRPAPPRTFVLRLAEPLQPGTTYRVTITGFRTLMGRTEQVTRTIQVPRAAEPRPAPTPAPTPRDTTPPPARPR